jgi:NitT/TauT family transport system ATP-binding protein
MCSDAQRIEDRMLEAPTDALEVVADLDRVTVTFPVKDAAPRQVLSEFSLQARRGEIVVLVGRSGCGKTTVLNVMAGLVEPTSGEVTVAGVAPSKARRSLGYMFARDALIPWRTALGNVEFALESRGKHQKSERRELARHYLGLIGLSGSESHYPGQLSQGMRQRVALARTWSLEPDVLLMDEPFGALDALTRASVQEEFLKLWIRDRRTIIFVTHDLDEAVMMGDRILVIDESKVVGEFRVPFSRPRRLHDLSARPEFRQLTADLRGALETKPVTDTEAS